MLIKYLSNPQVSKEQLEQNISDLEIDSIIKERMISDLEIEVEKLKRKVGE